MFALGDVDPQARILGCADGPASFNAEATRRGRTVVSCDPLYRYDAASIRGRIAATYDVVLAQTRANRAGFVWDTFASVEELGAARMAAMRTFLQDFDAGKAQGRYVEAALPTLPFADRSFDLAVCSHFLFLYTEQLSAAFHCAAMRELCRIAGEVRVFPLLALDGTESRHVEAVARCVEAAGFGMSIEPVPYEFQRGGNRMMRVHRPASARG